MIIQVEKNGAKIGDPIIHYISDVLPSPGDTIEAIFGDGPLRKYSVIRVNHILTTSESESEAESRFLRSRSVVIVEG
jgi:hypothetical protein